MESIAKPLRVLHDEASWFARATEMRLLHVRCDGAMRSSALTVLGSMEAHAANKSPYVVLEDAWTHARRGWDARRERLHQHWEERRHITMDAGIELGRLDQPSSTDPFGAFGASLGAALRALRTPLSGLVVVLAPVRIEDGAAFEEEVRELLSRPELAAVRWIVVDLFEADLMALHEALGAAAMGVECVRDDDAFTADLSALMTSVDPAIPGPAMAGAAWPRGVLPPQRPSEPMPTDEQRLDAEIELAAAGAPVGLVGEAGARLQQYVLAAAIAMKTGDGETALSYQQEAFRIASAGQGHREALLMGMVLAGYELALGREDASEQTYRGVVDRAEVGGFALERAQAGLALALIASRRGLHTEAAREYGEAANAALRAGAVALAIECWRLAGHMASEAGLRERAAECWQRAIDLAEEGDVSVARASSAPLAARQLAERLRARGQSAQALSLEHQANRIEAGETRAAREERA